MRPPDLDLGSEVKGWWTQWAPDRPLNPQYADLPDLPKCGITLRHKMPTGDWHAGRVTLRLEPHTSRLFPGRPTWEVQSWEPLTLTPSVLCSCGWHGFITNGRWVNC